jgi:hypothetical protein
MLQNIGKHRETKQGIESINHYDVNFEALCISFYRLGKHARTRTETHPEICIRETDRCSFSSSHPPPRSSYLRLSPQFSHYLVLVDSYRDFQYTVWNAKVPHYVKETQSYQNIMKKVHPTTNIPREIGCFVRPSSCRAIIFAPQANCSPYWMLRSRVRDGRSITEPHRFERVDMD